MSGLQRLISVAAVALVALGLGLLLVQRTQPPTRAQVAMAAAEEVALNHRKELAAEFSAGDFTELATQMPKLDFSPIKPQCLRCGCCKQGPGCRMKVGARYCTVGGQIAAQMRVQDRRGRALTLYQIRPDGRLASLPETEVVVDGVKVSMWYEAGLLMAMASPLD